MKYLLSLVLLTASVLSHGAGTEENMVIYVYQDDCGACIKFNKEVAHIYPTTSEAEQLPMVKVSLDDWRNDRHDFTQCQTREVFGTPTFLQVRNCQEIDRITGYTSDELFWLALTRMRNTVLEQSGH